MKSLVLIAVRQQKLSLIFEMEKKSASGSIPALPPPLPCYCKQGDCVGPVIGYIAEALSSDIPLWARVLQALEQVPL